MGDLHSSLQSLSPSWTDHADSDFQFIASIYVSVTSNKKVNSDCAIYIQEDVIKGRHVYKEMWTPACGEALEDFETLEDIETF